MDGRATATWSQLPIYDKSLVQADIEVLIGNDVYAKLLTGRKIELRSGLVALETKLGWTVSGKINSIQSYREEKYVHKTPTLAGSFHIRDLPIQQLWDLDVIGITDCEKDRTRKELADAALVHFKNTVTRNQDGRYKVKLPWVDGHASLPSYRGISAAKLESTANKVKKDGVLEAYHGVFKSWEDEGIIERVDGTGCGHYLSHHGVIKLDSPTTPVRPVFNGSFKTKGNPSLNDCLEVGPNMLEEIPAILVRFRLGPVGVTSDIRKAFLQIEVAEEDRDFLRFLWYTDESCSEQVVFRHGRVVFGISSSPFLLAATINHHLENYLFKYPETTRLLKQSFYVENCVATLASLDKASKFKEESVEIFSDAKMDLRAWEIGPSGEDKDVPVLGMLWNLKSDRLMCDNRGIMKKLNEKPTCRRKILSVAHSLFDPIGFTCPFTIIPKMLLQESHKFKLAWDTPLPEDINLRFKAWADQLQDIGSIQIPRFIALSQDTPTWSLHVFTDASSLAYAACAYLRSEANKQVDVQLVMARARLAPLKKQTIPRLELIGCLCGARLADNLKKIMSETPKIPVTYLTDSTTALAWIKNDRSWSVFVSGRVKEIRGLSSSEDWRHVPGKLNPADLPSRGASVKQLLEKTWWEGPEWLKLEESEWPMSAAQENEEEVLNELKKTVVSHLNLECEAFLKVLNKFSDYSKMIRVVAYARRFINCFRRKFGAKKDICCLSKDTPIGCEEYTEAETVVLRMVQKANFEGVKDARFKNIRIYEDKDGLLKCKMRLFPGEEEEDSAPIVLPQKDPVVMKLIGSTHIKSCHAGSSFLLTKLREKYWILGGRRTLRSAIARCVRCKRFRARPVQVEQGPLPLDRIKTTTAFDVTGVDMAGPLIVKGNKKIYIAVFTCAVYRAVHLELCTSLSTESFIAALRRFVSRRGRPSVIYSDNGTNFVGTSNLLNSLDWNKVAEYNNVEKIRWKFNPPTASWWGGFWERIIRIVKEMLRAVLGSSRVTYEELYTILCDIESIINNRPLTYVSEDNGELKPLTPDLFIRGNGTSILPDVDVVERDLLVARYKNMRKCLEELRSRFRKEYLSMLVSSSSGKSQIVKVGDEVLIGFDNIKRLNWPMGIVVEVIPGRDGVVRLAKVKTTTGIHRRPV